jgi:hypothetical protein
MQEGLLWFDADAKTAPQAKLAEAAARFAERFGRPANCCHVHPDELFAAPDFVVVPNPAVLRHHFWVGRDEALAAAAGSARRERSRKRSA